MHSLGTGGSPRRPGKGARNTCNAHAAWERRHDWLTQLENVEGTFAWRVASTRRRRAALEDGPEAPRVRQLGGPEVARVEVRPQVDEAPARGARLVAGHQHRQRV